MFDQFIWQVIKINETCHIKLPYITSGTDTAADYKCGKQPQEKEISFIKTLTHSLHLFVEMNVHGMKVLTLHMFIVVYFDFRIFVLTYFM